MTHIKLIVIISAILLAGTIMSMRRIKRWEEDKFKRTREIMKLKEFIKNINKKMKQKEKK